MPADKKIPLKKLAISTNGEVRFIPFEEIIYCNAINNYTNIFVRGGKSYLCCKTLKHIESRLPLEIFIRIHHSYLVNLGFITALKKSTGQLEIDNALLLPISRNKKTAVYQLLDIYSPVM